MQTIRVDLNNEHSVGLGDNLCFLSAMATLPPHVKLSVTNKHNTYDRLVKYSKIFRIPSMRLEIEKSETEGTFHNTGWPIKIFTDYYKTNIVNANGNLIKINPNGKKCIALVTASEPDTSGRNEWPWCRNRPPEYWEKVFGWIKSLGYEVITLDHPFFDLETKVELLAKHCAAIITYEGGMAHLAHMMNIPCFIIDWKHPSPSTHLSVFHVDFVHRSNSTYIIRSDDEIFSWDSDTFNKHICDLLDGKSNNRLLNGDFYFKFELESFRGNLQVYNKNGLLCLDCSSIFGSPYANFLHKYYQTV